MLEDQAPTYIPPTTSDTQMWCRVILIATDLLISTYMTLADEIYIGYTIASGTRIQEQLDLMRL